MRPTQTLPTIILCVLIIFFSAGNLCAQNPSTDSALLKRIADLENQVSYKKSGDEHFLIAGLATFGFVGNKTTVNSNEIPTGNKNK